MSWGGNPQIPQTLIVNEGTGPCDIRAPTQFGSTGTGAGVDRPHVAYVRNLPQPSNTFWVEWGGAIDQRICVRQVVVDPTRTLSSPGPTVFVPSTVGGVGDAMIRASGNYLFVMYSAAPLTWDSCAPQTDTWSLAYTADAGAHWQSSVVTASTSMMPCFGAPPSGPPLGRTNNAGSTFAFDVDRFDNLWAVFLDGVVVTSGAIRTVVPQVRVMRNTVARMVLGQPWQNDTVMPTEAAMVGEPFLSVDQSGNVAVSWYQATNGAGTQLVRMVAARDASSGAWSLPVPVSNPFAAIRVVGNDAGLGEYQASTMIDATVFQSPRSFFFAWSASDSTGSFARVDGARLAVTP